MMKLAKDRENGYRLIEPPINQLLQKYFDQIGKSAARSPCSVKLKPTDRSRSSSNRLSTGYSHGQQRRMDARMWDSSYAPARAGSSPAKTRKPTPDQA